MTAALETGGETSLAAYAFKRLRSAILRGELAPGARLRLEALQATYGLSSSPLREALNRLTAEGLIEVEDRRGFRVAPVSAEALEDLVRVRLLLEREALRASIARGDDAWEGRVVAAFHRLQLIEARLADVSPSLDDEWSARHRDFHVSLFSGCGSPILLQLCTAYFEQGDRYRRLAAKLRRQPLRKATEHRKIMEAALTRQEALALALVTDHITQTAAILRAVFAPAASDKPKKSRKPSSRP